MNVFTATKTQHKGFLHVALAVAFLLLTGLFLQACAGGGAPEAGSQASTTQGEGGSEDTNKEIPPREIWIVESVKGTRMYEPYPDIVSTLDSTGTYDENGRLVSRSEVTFEGDVFDAATYMYDDQGRLTGYIGREEDEVGGIFSEEWACDWSEDGLTANWNSLNTAISMSATFTYDEEGKLIEFNGHDMHVGQNTSNTLAKYTYDELGRIVFIIGTDGWNPATVDIYYSEDGSLARITKESTSGESWTALFNENNQIESYETPGYGYRYEYDSSGALTGISGIGDIGVNCEITTDENGNIATATLTSLPIPHGSYTKTDLEFTWRKVTPDENGHYPQGVACMLNPMALNTLYTSLTTDLFSPIEGGVPTSLAEIDRLVQESLARANGASAEELKHAAEYRLGESTEGGDDAGTEGSEASSANTDYHVNTANFEFDIPTYWRGKVEWAEDEGGRVGVYPIGMYDFPLIMVSIQDGPEPQAYGDIGTSWVAGTTGTDSHIEVWRDRYAYFLATGPQSFNTLSDDQIGTLIDLSTMGEFTADEVRNLADPSDSRIFAGEQQLSEELNATLIQH